MKKNNIILVIILVISFFLRFYKLTSYPVSLSMDEVAIGYNAYSILITGKDEWNESLPLAFRSANDYKPPVNIYLTIPSIIFFGFTEFAIRFPVAFLSALTPLVFYFLLKSLGQKQKTCLFGAFWMAILPWHIHYSRASFEAITGLFFLLLGTTTFLQYINKRKTYFILIATTSFSLSVWSYHAPRLFVPLFVLFLIILFWSKLKNIPKKDLFSSLILVTVFALPFLKLLFFTPAIKTRANVTSILNEPSLAANLSTSYPDLSHFIFDHNIPKIIFHWLGKYLNYFDLNFWLNQGLRFTPPDYFDVGLILPVDIILFVAGIIFIFKSKSSKIKKITLFWFLLGPLPASLAMNDQHSLRSLLWLPAFGIIISLGFQKLLEKSSRRLFLLYFPILIINFIYAANIYTIQFPHFFSEYWQFGYKEVSQFVCDNSYKYDKIHISDTFGSQGPLNTGLPYLYYLTYCQYDPATFQENRIIDKISFNRPDWTNTSFNSNVLLIGSKWDFPDIENIPKKNIIKTVKYKNNIDAFYIVETGQ